MSAYLDTQTGNVLLMTILLCGLIAWSILRARRGREIGLRDFAALDAIEAAVADAIAAGRPVFFVPGVRDLDNMQTVAALSVLAPVADQVARGGGRLFVPTSRSMVMEAARDICRDAYAAAGREDLWDEDQVTYISDDQLGFVARVDGLIERQRPGLCLFMGYFASESLLLAEGAQHVGAVQIAGTASPVQLPFFVAACDHTLIGEEFFAAGASLARDKPMLGSLQGQDLGKLVAIACIVGGVLIVTLADLSGADALLRLRGLFFDLFRAG
ncbi:hypothetical protein H8E07_05115 [bacterium]|nr:hypothetical protein [bacterium]